ncbi:MAG TPA: VOC family protein [bacterium]|jgi:catechol 2,3-dioxygenase-like lactoylglutathione lyase family enzyme|nr:VOC family protein [bacterium]
MTTLTQVILYVSDPARSSSFYAEILGLTPKSLSPNFAIFELAQGVQLGLLLRSTVEPAADKGISSELCLIVDSKEALEALHKQWAGRGMRIILPPQLMYFGAVNFMAEDADGNRIRVSTPDK